MTSSVRAKMAQVEKEKKVARREAMANPEIAKDPEVATEMVRARNDQGHYIADDPKTPESMKRGLKSPKRKRLLKRKPLPKRKPQKKANGGITKRFSKIARPQRFQGIF